MLVRNTMRTHGDSSHGDKGKGKFEDRVLKENEKHLKNT